MEEKEKDQVKEDSTKEESTENDFFGADFILDYIEEQGIYIRE